MHVSIAGEVRCVVRKADGSIKTDTGFQKNLVLNQGLDFFGGNNGSSMFGRCAVGSGNSTPLITQTSLDVFVASQTGTLYSTKYDYIDDGSNLYKTNQVYRYRFSNIGDVNLSEVGLASQGSTKDNTYLCTRALIKDALGAPTSISIKSDETLDIFYRLWNVHSLLDTKGQINLLDGSGGSIPYNYTVRPAAVGGTNIGGSAGHKNAIGLELYVTNGNNSHYINDGDLGDIKNAPLGSRIWSSGDSRALPMEAYIPHSYKRVATCSLPLSSAVGNIRSFLLLSSMGIWQIRYGSVADDSPIFKTAKDTVTMPFEFSWGRYEGDL